MVECPWRFVHLPGSKCSFLWMLKMQTNKNYSQQTQQSKLKAIKISEIWKPPDGPFQSKSCDHTGKYSTSVVNQSENKQYFYIFKIQVALPKRRFA